MDFMAIGQQFVQHYYNVFDTARPVSSSSFVCLNFYLLIIIIIFLHNDPLSLEP